MSRQFAIPMGRIRRRQLLIAAGALLAMPLESHSQQPARVRRIGVLGAATADGYARQIKALREGLREQGYNEGQNLLLEFRWAEGRYERLATLAAELVRLQPDVIVTSGPGTRALKEATTTIPIVMAVGGDPVAAGLISNLARPEGNITGSTFFGPEVAGKRLELLKEALPRVTKVGVMFNSNDRSNGLDFERMRNTAAALQIELLNVPVRSPRDFEEAFAGLHNQRLDALVFLADTMLVANMRHLGELSAARRLLGAGSDEYADGGGLIAYGVNFPDLWRRAAYFVARILKGSKPADLPVEQARTFELILNRRLAREVGVSIPQSILVRADRVIE